MDRHVYTRMAELEDGHWWFVARRRILTDALTRYADLPPDARVLEAGCGTGGNLPMLAAFGSVVGFEPDAEARELARRHGDFDVREGWLPERVPFETEGFDLVAALDVLEHVADHESSLRALGARLRPGGWALVTVPAFPALWSRHDVAHHHHRRYAKADLLRLAGAAGLMPVVATYFNTLLFPVTAGVRLARTRLGMEGPEDDTLPPAPANRLLCGLFASERHVLGRLPLPFGVSLFLLARKPVVQ